MRLDKYLAHMGFGSRKELKKILKERAVQVNGVMVTKGERSVDPVKDRITVLGEPVLYQEHIYLMMNKPAGYISATEDQYQHTVLDLLAEKDRHWDIFPAGRLDKDTEGLLLLTSNGKLAHFLLSPRRHVEKVYYARVKGQMDEADSHRFQEGIVLADGFHCLPADLEITAFQQNTDTSEVLITIKEGKFHQVKRMVQSCGKEVLYLKRLHMGPLQLDPNLAPGEYRPLTETELSLLLDLIPA